MVLAVDIGNSTYFTFATVDKCNDRRSSTFTFTVCDYYRFITFKY